MYKRQVHRHLLRVGHVLYVAFGNDRLHRHLGKTARQSVQKSPGFLHIGTPSALTLQTYLQVRIVIGEYQIENIAGHAELHRAVRIAFRHVVSYLLLRLTQGFPVLRLKVDHGFGRGKVFGMGQHEILHADHRRRSLHQSVHLRGCKFGSGTYIMAPAIEGPFTLVLGRHTQHHDTSAFPFSYLVEQDGRSALMPGANLTSYGTVRDIGKWPERDRRTVKRDRINFEEDNPYLAGGMIDAVNTLNSLAEAHPDAESYVHNHALIRSTQLQRGLKLYNKAIVASLGAMLRNGEPGRADGTGRWNDVAGQYVPRREVKRILDAIANGGIDSLEGIDRAFGRIAADYDHYARSWAEGVLVQLLGHAPSPEEIAEAVTAGERTRETLHKSAEDDRARDCSPAMAVGYGVDADSEEEKMQDYHTVRGIR
mgnify:CR=1 FL=1